MDQTLFAEQGGKGKAPCKVEKRFSHGFRLAALNKDTSKNSVKMEKNLLASTSPIRKLYFLS